MRTRIAIRVMLMLLAVALLAGGLWWQARPVVAYWWGNAIPPKGWSAFLSGNRQFGCAWSIKRYVVFDRGVAAGMFDGNVGLRLLEETDPQGVADARRAGQSVVCIDATYSEIEYGRLRTTAIRRESYVGVSARFPDGTSRLVTEDERRQALQLLFADPRQITAGSDLDGLGGELFKRYLDRPVMDHRWKPLLLSVGQTTLMIAMIGTMVWLLWRSVWECRGGARVARRRAGLCEECGYPVVVAGGICPECGVAGS